MNWKSQARDGRENGDVVNSHNRAMDGGPLRSKGGVAWRAKHSPVRRKKRSHQSQTQNSIKIMMAFWQKAKSGTSHERDTGTLRPKKEIIAIKLGPKRGLGGGAVGLGKTGAKVPGKVTRD